MLSSWYLLLAAALSTNAGHGGYLDRVAQYRKQKFIEALKERLPPLRFNGPLPPIPSDVDDKDNDVIHIRVAQSELEKPLPDLVNVTAKIIPQPAGFKDSPKWDVASVSRLLDLLRVSKSGRRVLKTLRRSMQPSRRWMMSKQLSYKLFPNINEGNYYESEDDEGELYTDEETENQYPQMMGDFTEDSVVIVANPVEARLPSGHISVAMLRKIMEQRAEAGRAMPSTTVATVTWQTILTQKGGKTTTKAGAGAGDDTSTTPTGEVDDVTTTTTNDNNAPNEDESDTTSSPGGEDEDTTTMTEHTEPIETTEPPEPAVNNEPAGPPEPPR